MSAQRLRRRAQQQGVTLVELMIVVVIISVLAGTFGTSVRRTVLEQRAGAATRQIVQLVRDARLNASVLRIAHAVLFDPAHSRVRMLHAAYNSCTAANWTALDTQCSNATDSVRASGTECQSIDLAEPPWSYPGAPYLRLRELLLSGGTTPGPDVVSADSRLICFAPNGSVFQAAAGGALDANFTTGGVSLGGGFLFQLDMLWPGATETTTAFVPRQVLVPFNGLAKVVR